MSWTKRQFVIHAFEEVGYSSYSYDLDPAQLESGMRRLDAMMATWNGKGIRLGYPIPNSPEDADLDEETNVPDAANEAIYLNLAIRIAPTIGKTASMETKASAREAFDQLLIMAVTPNEMQMPGTMPSGAGNKPYRSESEYLRKPTDNLDVGKDSELDLGGGAADATEEESSNELVYGEGVWA